MNACILQIYVIDTHFGYIKRFMWGISTMDVEMPFPLEMRGFHPVILQ